MDTLNNIISFEDWVNEEMGSGDLPAGCHKCGKKRKEKKQKKMKWSSEIMAESVEEEHEMEYDLKKKKEKEKGKKGGRKVIKDSKGHSHID